MSELLWEKKVGQIKDVLCRVVETVRREGDQRVDYLSLPPYREQAMEIKCHGVPRYAVCYARCAGRQQN